MKHLLIIFLTISRTSNCFINDVGYSDHKNVAVKDFILKQFYGNFNNIKIISSVAEGSEIRSSRFITGLMSELDSTIKVSLGFSSDNKTYPDGGDSLVLVLIDSFESFENVKHKLLIENTHMDKYYLLVLLDDIFADVSKVFKSFWRHWIFHANIVSEANDGRVIMNTFFPFSRESCGSDDSLVLINQFDPATRIWSSLNFFPEKFSNLNGCPLKIAVLSANAPSVLIEKSESDEKSYSGLEVDLMREIVQEFDLQLQFEDFERIDNVNGNGSVQRGLLSSVKSKQFDAALGTLSLQHDRLQFLSATTSFLTVPIILVIPPADIISPFHKLVKPFTVNVWISFVTLFLIGFAVILLLRVFASKNAYNFIVGKGVTNPFFNMLIAFFGEAQHKLPRTNFARYLLMNFLLFCLVVRCIYQGKLFFMLQAELHEKQIETIHDVVERNMAFYTYESLNKRLQGMKFASRCVSIPKSELEAYLQKTLNPSFRGIVFNYLTQVLYLNTLNYQNFTYHIADEALMTNQLVFYFQRNHFLVDKVSEKIGIFHEAGLIEKIMLKYMDNRFLNLKRSEHNPNKLTVSHLSAVFGVWSSFLMLSFLTFIMENFLKHLKCMTK